VNEAAWSLGVTIACMSFLAMSAYLLLLAGKLSFGQQMYFGIGAYATAMLTSLWGWNLWVASLVAAAINALIGGSLARLLRDLYGAPFAVASLLLAELCRLGFSQFEFTRTIHGELLGPQGLNGFGQIRWVLEQGWNIRDYALVVFGFLVSVLAIFYLIENSRTGLRLRMLGVDPMLARCQGIRVDHYQVAVGAVAACVASLGGGFYAHSMTYIEPALFDLMMGVHAVLYAYIGGLGSVLGALLGVAFDIGILAFIDTIRQHRMTLFAMVMLILLIVRPRGILDESLARRLRLLPRSRHAP
jgi:branched-chain amino acid transport system permease protein